VEESLEWRTLHEGRHLVAVHIRHIRVRHIRASVLVNLHPHGNDGGFYLGNQVGKARRPLLGLRCRGQCLPGKPVISLRRQHHRGANRRRGGKQRQPPRRQNPAAGSNVRICHDLSLQKIIEPLRLIGGLAPSHYGDLSRALICPVEDVNSS